MSDEFVDSLKSKVAKQRNEIARLSQSLKKATDDKFQLLKELKEVKEDLEKAIK